MLDKLESDCWMIEDVDIALLFVIPSHEQHATNK